MIEIHDMINVLLALFLCQQLYVYVNKNTEKEENTYETPTTTNASSLLDNNIMNYINKKIEDILKQLFLKNRDAEAVYNPLKPPEQRMESRQYPYPQNLFLERTRGEPDDYQLVGLLYNTDVNKNYQLYGRRVYPGSYEWEYYILGKDLGGLEFKYPIQINNKEEIRDGMTLTLPIDKNTYTVSIYNYDQPRYNPFPVF
jgi:hypothetical protein